MYRILPFPPSLIALLFLLLTNCSAVLQQRTTLDAGTELRILPLGDEITSGFGSTDGNGYRLRVQQNLAGSDVSFVGAQQSGNMTDNYNDGFANATISEISSNLTKTLAGEGPNIVLLYAGTTDLVTNPLNQNYTEASQRLTDLILQIFAACPNTTVLVAKIIDAADSATNARIQTFNDQVPNLVGALALTGHDVFLVDMSVIKPSQFVDGIYPNDAAYSQMGDLWYSAIQTLVSQKAIKPPQTSGSAPNTGVLKTTSSPTSPTGIQGQTSPATIVSPLPSVANSADLTIPLLIPYTSDGHSADKTVYFTMPKPTVSSDTRSTVTIPPSGFSAQTLTGTTVSGDYWTTTNVAGGSTTLLPVVTGANKNPIVLWNVGNTPHVVFNLPGVPAFSLPCIKVPILGSLGCQQPPQNEQSSSGNGGNTGGGSPGTGPGGGEPDGDNSSASNNEQSKTSKTRTSTSSSCKSTATASNCEIFCSSDTSKSTTACYSTTCYDTVTGCSATGTTTTIQTTSSVCIPVVPSDISKATQTGVCGIVCGSRPDLRAIARNASGPSNPSITEPPNKRAIAGRIEYNHLQKRGGKQTISSLGGCQVPLILVRPSYPAPTKAFLVPESKGQPIAPSLQPVPRYDLATVSNCVFTTTRVDAKAFANAPLYTAYDTRPRPINNLASMDHVYESKWLSDFFNTVINPSGNNNRINCNQLQSIFYPIPQGCSQLDFLQPVWDALASSKHPDFVIMSQYLNGMKGTAMEMTWNDQILLGQGSTVNPGMTWSEAKTKIIALQISKLTEMIQLCLEMNTNGLPEAMQRTNNRIYAAMRDFDAAVAAPNAPNIFGAATLTDIRTHLPNGLAAAYKLWANTQLAPVINKPSVYTSNLARLLNSNLASLQNYNTAMNGWNQNEFSIYFNGVLKTLTPYNNGGGGSYKWQYNFVWDWNPSNVKRDSEPDLIAARQEPDSCQDVPSSLSVDAATPIPSSPASAGITSITTPASKTTTVGPGPISCEPNVNSEDSDGKCTCVFGGATLAPTTPSAGLYQACATLLPSKTIAMVPAVTTPSVSATEPVFYCLEDESPEDSDGLCTCVVGGTKTLAPTTPVKGRYQPCATTPPP